MLNAEDVRRHAINDLQMAHHVNIVSAARWEQIQEYNRLDTLAGGFE